MADPLKKDAVPPGPQYSPPKPQSKQNPVFRMMGIPRIRLRLPSRNWMIFLTITGSFTAAVTYDRRQKKLIQKKWCDLVGHIAQQPLSVDRMPRKLTIFLSAPPGDGIRTSREYFKEYIKPVLVAAAMDYDVIEGRKEGDVRYGTAEQIRRLRRKKGETGSDPQEREPDVEEAVAIIREKLHVLPEPGLRGDLVLGRHTWKEYIRGLHEGWLGPLGPPPIPVEVNNELPLSPLSQEIDGGTSEAPTSSTEAKSDDTKPKDTDKKPPFPPPSYISTDIYSSSALSPHTPNVFEPSSPIHQQHILGFLKFPIRIYHFLNRRALADHLGRETAAIVLANHRPYQQDSSFASTSSEEPLDATPLATRAPENDVAVVQTSETWEQQPVLLSEEDSWHKSVRKQPKKEEDKIERVWLNDIIVDSRIGQRMRRFELDPSEEERANRIATGVEKGLAVPLEDLRSEKVKLGDLDE